MMKKLTFKRDYTRITRIYQAPSPKSSHLHYYHGERSRGYGTCVISRNVSAKNLILAIDGGWMGWWSLARIKWICNYLFNPPGFRSFQLPVSQPAGARRGSGDGAGLFTCQVHNWPGRGSRRQCVGSLRPGTSVAVPGTDFDQLYRVRRLSIGYF